MAYRANDIHDFVNNHEYTLMRFALTLFPHKESNNQQDSMVRNYITVEIYKLLSNPIMHLGNNS